MERTRLEAAYKARKNERSVQIEQERNDEPVTIVFKTENPLEYEIGENNE